MTNVSEIDRPYTDGRLVVGGLFVGLAGAIAWLIGLAVAPRAALFAYLGAYAYLHSVVLGVLAFLLICHAMGATWPIALRRLGEAAIGAMPLLALLFVPVLLGVGWLYPFRHPEEVADPEWRELLEHKLAWLSTWFFVVRAIVYQAVWLVAAWLLRRWSFEMDARTGFGAPDRTRALRVAGAALLPPVGLTLTFAAYDWLMALSPDWYSTMFGLYYSTGGLVAGVALLAVLTRRAQASGRLAAVGESHWYALGRLLLAFLVTWAYIAFFQFFLIWIADKPIESRWYLERVRGGWKWVSGFLGIGHFAAPFLLLLSYRLKRSAVAMAAMAAWLLGVHWLDVHWLVAPARSGAPVIDWLDPAALALIGGPLVAFAAWRQRGHALVATDPALPRALAYSSR